MKSISNKRPAVLQDLGNGTSEYHFNITENEEMFECDCVIVSGTPTYDSVVRSVIRDFIDESKEFSIINKYNAYQMGISTDENDKKQYEDYLRKVASIKEMVRNDLNVII